MAFARGKFHLWNFKMWIRFTVMFGALMHLNVRAKRKLEFQEILFRNVYIRMLLERRKTAKLCQVEFKFSSAFSSLSTH